MIHLSGRDEKSNRREKHQILSEENQPTSKGNYVDKHNFSRDRPWTLHIPVHVQFFKLALLLHNSAHAVSQFCG